MSQQMKLEKTLASLVSNRRPKMSATANQKRTCIRKLIEKVMSLYDHALAKHSRDTKVKSDIGGKDQELCQSFKETTREVFGDAIPEDSFRRLFSTVLRMHIRGGSKTKSFSKFSRILRSFDDSLSESAIRELFQDAMMV